MFRKTIKSQSILEYSIFLATVIVALLIGTGVYHNGLRDSLNISQEVMKKNVEGNDVPSEIRNEKYYRDSRERSDSNWYTNLDNKNIDPDFDPNKYYFHEGNTDTSHIPPQGTILGYKNTYVPQEPAGADYQ